MHPKKYENRTMSNDARIAVLETTISNINSSLLDIKHAFDRIDNRFLSFEQKIEAKFEQFENRIDSKLEQFENRIDSKLEHLENKMDAKLEHLENKMDARFAQIDVRFEKIDSKFDLINNRLWSNFLWTISMIIGLAGLIAHTQHWI